MNIIKKLKSRKNILAIVIIFTLLALSSTLFFKSQLKDFFFNNPSRGSQVWINIFAHGTFGSAIGLINPHRVLQDKVSGTSYKKIVAKMRKNPLFYVKQTILERGLKKISPTFDKELNRTVHPAAYPIIKAYDTLNRQIPQNLLQKNVYYTFGWSGLISQERRRKEAIRLYNSLSEEISKYEKKGIKPKIRIIAHSHGGNLALNLAAIKKIIANKSTPNFRQSLDKNEQESLKLMENQICSLKSKKNNLNSLGQKALDYIPTNKSLFIDELIMLGTPIQPETESFAFYEIFKKVYNIYSEEDVIQEIDFISTKKGFSEQRINAPKKWKNSKKIKQVKIMVEHEQLKQNVKGKETYSQLLATNEIEQNKNDSSSIWDKFLSKNRFFKKVTCDPTHKQLWFISWNAAKQMPNNVLEFLPSVIFVPLITNALDKNSLRANDLDVNIVLDIEKLRFFFYEHNKIKSLHKLSIPRNSINKIRSEFLKWMPEEKLKLEELEITKNILRNIEQKEKTIL